MFAGSRLDPDAVFNEYVSEVREMLGIAIPVADVMQAPLGPGAVTQVRDLMHRRTDAEPGSGLSVIIEDHVLAQPEAQLLHHEVTIGGDIGSQQIHVVQTTHGDTAQGSLLRSVQEFGLLLRRSLVVLHVPQYLHVVSIRIGELIGSTVSLITVDPPLAQSSGLN